MVGSSGQSGYCFLGAGLCVGHCALAGGFSVCSVCEGGRTSVALTIVASHRGPLWLRLLWRDFVGLVIAFRRRPLCRALCACGLECVGGLHF